MANAPATKFQIGFVTATVWKNNGTSKPFYTVDLTRSYKDNDGEYQNGSSLSHADLLNAARLLQRAEAWIAEQ
jgi:hypothetical protein